MASTVMLALFQIQTSLRFSHWRSKSYSEHKGLDKFLDKFNDKMDEFIETYQGKYGRIDFKNSQKELSVLKIEDLNKYLDVLIGFFIGKSEKDCKKFKLSGNKDYCGITVMDIIKKDDTDLLNIRDEILGLIHKLKYLLTLQ